MLHRVQPKENSQLTKFGKRKLNVRILKPGPPSEASFRQQYLHVETGELINMTRATGIEPIPSRIPGGRSIH